MNNQESNVDIAYLDRFEGKLQEELLRLCTSYNMLDRVMLETDDINEHWHKLAPEYVADAVNEIAAYPVVSVAWAAYLGMAVAYAWDVDWATFQKAPYQAYYGEQGFDDMDEHIVKNLLGIKLDSEEAADIEKMLRRCGETAVALIRYENIEPQSPMAFHVFARAVKTMFRIGAAIELNRMGYKFEKVDMAQKSEVADSEPLS